MTNHFLEFSIVVVANDHNPTIINPDFLRINHIAEEGWKPTDSPVSTPAFSRVMYDNGLTITVDPNRLNIVDASRNPSVLDSPAIKVAEKYAEELPHIRYSAIGFNFRVFYEAENPDEIIKSKFLNDGLWLEPRENIHGLGFKFSRQIDHGKSLVTVESAVVNLINADDGSFSAKSGIMVFVNFHRDCTGYPSTEQLRTYFGSLSEDWDSFQTVLEKLSLDHE